VTRWALALLATAACVSDAQPLMFATVSGVRIQPTDEAGDEWLHAHCVFHGLATAENTQDVIAAAQAHRSNFAEPLSQSIDDRGFWSKTTSYSVAFFSCQESPPW
jgi:hypothetical protein